jgi:DNA polymerase III epsilon subunit-like protein
MRYIAFDTETGGLEPDKVDILTGYFAILDENLQLQAELDLKVRPDGDAPYRVTAGALAINGINLVQHHREALTKTDAAACLRTFLGNYKPGGREKLIPVGQNVPFDIDFCRQMMPKKDWEGYCSYRKVDTADIAHFLALCGKINPKNFSLESLVEYFALPKTQAHNAKNDTLMTIMVLRELRKIVG